ncbi:transposable element Tcb2 transposase [Trichonephila clavipes]|nr:transposable element Tcb2 transposase [Trichonephila clavipes]
MEAGWSARRVARQLGHSDCVVRRCWDQWIREMSFTRRPSSGLPRQTSRREDSHIRRERESRINLSSDDDVRVWRPRGECLNPAFVLQRHIAPTAGVMVLGAIAYNTWSPLVLICGTMTAQRDCLHTVATLLWPTLSPDLSQIEHIWDHLGWRVVHSTSLNELEERLQQIRNKMSQDITELLCLNARSYRIVYSC